MEQRLQQTTEGFEYQRHIFDARDAPVCAIFALQQAAKENAENYPDVLKIVTTDFYMDDFVKSVGSTEEALQLQQRLGHVLGSHSLNLIKWCSISRTFCSELNESLSTNEKDEIFTKINRQKVLEVSWFPLTDMFLQLTLTSTTRRSSRNGLNANC